MATIQKFEDLKVWQKARLLSQKIYSLTFSEPIKSDFRFKDQIRGSAGSIMDNIAEGFERKQIGIYKCSHYCKRRSWGTKISIIQRVR